MKPRLTKQTKDKHEYFKYLGHLLGEHSCDPGEHQQEKEDLSLEKLLWYDNGIWPL